MTLKEKFKNLNTSFGSNRKYYHHNLNKCEKIAEQFAINFANWYEFTLRETDNLNQRFTPKELIEMFKKQKGL
jgi:hypothetical protein